MPKALLAAPAILAMALIAGCGSSSTTTPTAGAATPTPTSAVASPSVSVPSNSGATGGYGDTTANPDQSYICAGQALADDHTTVVAYLTVAGGDKTTGQQFCSSLTSSGSFNSVSSIPAGTVGSKADCYVTYTGGIITARIYQAKDGGVSTTQQLCASLLQASGVSATP